MEGLTQYICRLVNGSLIVPIGGFVSIALTLMLVGHAGAQLHEDFEGDTTSWKNVAAGARQSDRSWLQTREFDAERQSGFEQVRFRAIDGVKAMVAHPIMPCYVIPELGASVRIKSQRQGVQLCARVVLPDSRSVVDGKPLTVLLRGPKSRQRGKWETLELTDRFSVHQKLNSEIWILRREHGGSVSTQGAYIDQVLLDLHCGPGLSVVGIDDLKVSGVVEATPVAGSDDVRLGDVIRDPSVAPASAQSPIGAGSSKAERDGSVLLVNQKPFFARIIEHNGEDFEFLKALGFNTIELPIAPDAKQLAAARKQDLWLIAPPPASVGIGPMDRDYDRVLAWSVGRQLAQRDLDSVRQRIREIRESDRRKGRPLFGNLASHVVDFQPHLDVLSVGQQPIGSSLIASRYSDWIQSQTAAARGSRPVCADVQTQYPRRAREQAQAVQGKSPPTPIEHQQLRFLATEAIAAGARALRFRSNSRLDADDLPTRLRSLSIQYTNRWLANFEPWVAGGVVMGKLPGTIGSHRPFEREEGSDQQEDLVVTALNTATGRLLLVQRETHHEQFWSGDCAPRPITIIDSDSIHTQRAFQLTDAELKPALVRRSPDGNSIAIDEAPFLTAIVMTQEARELARLRENLAPPGRASMFELHYSITQQWLAITQLIQEQLKQVGQEMPSASGAITSAMTAMQNVQQLRQRRSLSQAMPYLEKANERLAFFRREIQTEALRAFQSKTSSPLVGHVSLVPIHWMLAGQLPRSIQGINHLAAGDFENASHVTRSGWTNQKVSDSRLKIRVEFAKSAAVDGVYGLKMAVDGRGVGVIDKPPVRVTSPPIPVKARQLVRIHGWVNVPQPVRGSDHGLQIIESFGGDELAESIPVTGGWQEFTLYRIATEDKDLTVRFQLCGLGEASIDEVTVQIVDPRKSARAARIPGASDR